MASKGSPWPLLGLKALLSIPVAYGLLYPFWFQAGGGGVLATVEATGLVPFLLITLAFFGAIALYCRDLQRVLEGVHPDRRRASPRSVWFMFLLPFNFIEDFWIIHHVTQSLRAEAASVGEGWPLKNLGAFTGFGWCALQVVSLLPNRLGEAAGLLALPLWIAHWRTMRQALRALARPQPTP